MKILFVCTGNTCRSPMAAALMNKLALENDINAESASAGIFAEPDSPASKQAIAAMTDYGLNISEHKSTQLSEALINEADIILTMTEGQKTMICAHAPEKTFTICEFAGYDGDIIDPFGGNLEQYKQVAEDIYDCLTEIAEKIYDMIGN